MKLIPISLNYILIFIFSVSTLSAQIAADSQMYSIRYKGIRCNKSKSKEGDKITIFAVGNAAAVKRNGAVNVVVDSFVQLEQERVQTGMIYPANAPVFMGTIRQEANILSSVLVYDQSGKTREAIREGFGWIKTVAPSVVKVHDSFSGNKPSITTLNPDSVNTFSTAAPPNETQLKIESTFNAGDQVTAYLNSKEVKHDMIDKKTRPLEKKDIQTYLNAEPKIIEKDGEEIRYHFSIRIKNNKADYELFFDVKANE